jgi:hypothetical protein
MPQFCRRIPLPPFPSDTMKPLIAALLLFTAGFALAQTPAPPATNDDSNPRFWQAAFANGGHYLVKMEHIICASRHEYIGNGTARVVEVTIGTHTSLVARFYFLEPVGKDTKIAGAAAVMDRAEQLAKEAAGRVSPTAAQLNVIKDYPNTTHAHTVEYVLQSEEALGSLYQSLMQAINTGRGRTWKEATK